MKITRKQLRQLIKESLSSHQSELSYSHTNPPESKKALQKSYWKAHRGPAARADIESQLGSMELGDEDDRAIGEIVPAGPREWASYDGIPPDPAIPSEKLAYLYDLAYDVADGRVNMSEEDIAALDILTNDAFGWSFSYSVTGHGADFSAEAQRDEFYDTKEEQATTLSELFKGQHKMKITRSQLKNLIKEEMARIDEGSEDIAAHSASKEEFVKALRDKKELTVMYQESADNGGKWFQWTENPANKYMPHLPSITNNEKDKAPSGSVLYPNDGPRIVVGDNSPSRSTQAQRRTKLDDIDADSRL